MPKLGSPADSVTPHKQIVRLPTCECGKDHEGRPPDAKFKGCGLTFSIYVERTR